jgi:hypothetical protein
MAESAALLTDSGNYAVVQLPRRKFPGVVFQGDSTRNILAQLERIQLLARKYRDDELDAEINDLQELFSSVRRKFETVCAARGIELAYPPDS